MKILLTGAEGLLGSAIKRMAAVRGHACQRLNRSDIWPSMGKSIVPAVSEFDALIHTAANTDVEGCEQNPSACYRDNYLLTEVVAKIAASARVKLVFISSTGVYGNYRDTPYREYDDPRPTTHHHRSKLLAEDIVGRSDHSNLVVRVGWLFGSQARNKKDFVSQRIAEAKAALSEKKRLPANFQQRGVPCYSEDIAERIFELIDYQFAGVFNCVNSGFASRLDYVTNILEFAGICVPIEAKNSEGFNRVAAVSDNEMAENWKMTSMGLAPMPTWQESLRRYITSMEIGTV